MSAAVMAQLALYVGVDTGPTHLAARLASHGRSVPLPSSQPALCARQHPKLRVVDHPRPDDAAMRRTMAEIGVPPVWSAVRELLSARNGCRGMTSNAMRLLYVFRNHCMPRARGIQVAHTWPRWRNKA